MTRLTVAAAALVAGMTAIAANAQETPARAAAMQVTAEAKTAQPNAAVAARTGRGSLAPARVGEGTPVPSSAAPAKPVKTAEADVSTQYEQGMVFAHSVDATKTASIGKRKRPELVAVARKGVKGDAEEAVADAKVSFKVTGGGKYGALISRYATSYGVPLALAHAVIQVESNYRPNARGKAGEIGLMQIKPSTARAMGYTGGAAGLFHPETNIRFGMKYLAKAHQLGGGSTCTTILKYNAGHAARRMNPVSAAYCRKVKLHLGS